MTGDASASCMHQGIFSRGLPTATVSLYLLCCGLLDAGLKPTHSAISARWNAGDDQLAESLETLIADGILKAVSVPPGREQEFIAMAPTHWRPVA